MYPHPSKTLNNKVHQPQWISPTTINALKIYKNTLGKTPSLNIDLRLKNNLPFLEINPLLDKVDAMTWLTVPISCAFLITLYLLLNRTDPLSAIEIVQAVIIIGSVAIFIFCGILRYVFRKNTEFVTQFNALWHCNPTKTSEDTKGISSNEASFDLVGIMLLLLIVFLNVMGIPVYIILSYVRIDPVQATLQHCLNIPPNNITFVFGSVICIVLFILIGARETYIVAFVGVALLVRLKAELVALNSYGLLKSEYLSNRYIILRRQHLKLERVCSLGTACVVVFLQVAHCILFWMVCICWMLIPVYFSASCLALSIVSLVALWFGLDTESDCHVYSKNLLTKHLDGFHVYGIRGGRHAHLKRVWKCQLPLKIYCGRQFVVGKDAFLNYMDVFTDNLTNAVVLIKI